MGAEIITTAPPTLIGKGIDWIWNKITGRRNVKFIDPTITYCFSYFDAPVNYTHLDGQITICSVLFSVTLSNPTGRPKALTGLKLSAIANGRRYPMQLLDNDAGTGLSTFTLPAATTCRTGWSALVAGPGLMSVIPGVIPLEDCGTGLSFELTYSGKTGKARATTIRLTQGMMPSSQFIFGN